MERTLKDRWVMATVGAVAGLAFWGLFKAADSGLVADERILFVLAAAMAELFGALLAMAGPIGLYRAALRAVPLSLLISGLVAWVMTRWNGDGAAVPGLSALEGFFSAPMPTLAVLAAGLLPIPFLLAQAGGSWRAYPALFAHSWGIVVRGAVSAAFTGVVWGVIFLSDLLLGVVGLNLIGDIIEAETVPFVITGAVFGVAVAVVNELVADAGPRLFIRLLRLLMPLVFAVSTIFAVAALVWGFAQTFQWISPAGTLLVMSAAGITLVTLVLDHGEGEASQSPILRQSARGMALLVPVLAGLSAWAIWARVAQHGWTPERIFVAVLAGLACLYGLAYAASVLRGRGWEDRIRRANPPIALVVIGLAVLWLTPVLNAERLSAEAQVARYDRGETGAEALDLWEISRWGHAGTEALAQLKALAEAKADTAMLERLKDPSAAVETPVAEVDLAPLRAEVAAVLPLQPASATGTRDVMLGFMTQWELESLRDACARVTNGVPGCVMVVGDLATAIPGEEAVLAQDTGGWVSIEAIYPGGEGWLIRREMRTGDGAVITLEDGLALIAGWVAAPPPLTPAPIMQVGTGEDGLFFLP